MLEKTSGFGVRKKKARSPANEPCGSWREKEGDLGASDIQPGPSPDPAAVPSGSSSRGQWPHTGGTMA